jgi:hypothetical protein
MSQSAPLDLNLHPKQGLALNTDATELLYGGAAGGGKSHLMRVAAIIWCSMIPGLQVYLFRRIRDDLVKNHMEGPKGFRALLATWKGAGIVDIVEDEIRFWNGSKIYLCHCKDEKDIYKYQGAEIHVLLIDELTHFTERMYRFLRNRVRMVGVTVPAEWQGRFPRILCGANPGNVGHQFVKATFVDAASPMEVVRQAPAEGGMLRQFIPALLSDNPSMADDDPGYEGRLEGLGSAELVKAMRWGDWSVVEGAFFDNWSAARNVIRPCELAEHWTRFRSFDWGSARPFSVGWWCVAGETFRADGVVIKRGSLVRYREWYGCTGKPNEGLKMTAEEIARGILERELGDQISYGVADPAIFSEDGGPSHAERMYRAGVPWRRADNARVSRHGAIGGWDQMRSRISGDDEGPGLVVFNTCRDFIRTVPALQHDPARAEDIDTDAEDHAADEARYACMSRPYAAPTPKPAPEMRGTIIGSGAAMTADEMWARQERLDAERW